MVPGRGSARVIRIPPPKSLKGRETPGGATRSGRTGEGTRARTLRGRQSLREQPDGLRTVRQAERRNTSWSSKRRGGCGEPMSPLRRTERSERQLNPERVVPRTATSSWNSSRAFSFAGQHQFALLDKTPREGGSLGCVIALERYSGVD
jgi:hypothetical protein